MNTLKITSSLTMHNGSAIPLFGLGTYKAIDTIETAIKAAWDAGYRHLDTAAFYRNEKEIGRCIKKLNLPRDQLFVTSKLWYSEHGYDKAKAAFEQTLQKLDIGYLDLYLIHWPDANSGSDNPKVRRETWRALEDLYKEGKVKNIGVSNYTERHLEEMFVGKYKVDVPPMVNQFELHPKLTQKSLVAYCKNKNIVVESYSPFAKGELIGNVGLKKIGQKYGVSEAQVIVRWILQQDIVCIPKSDKPDRIVSNADVYKFELTEEDMNKIDGMNEDYHCTWDPTNVQ
ncbi:9,11-endoperoxide prostaglandin H2 reductase [Acrasis kona]|uniref:9,11-endoperoxide prostaglandin H2 reductase n=1 Tax=Acrasis kona TaxID=1008807 RepID=A0AAW2ZFU3_9EUKA